MIGVITNDTARYAMFYIAKDGLILPVNTAKQHSLTGDRILGRNKLAKLAIETGMEWLLFLDDDVIPDPGLVGAHVKTHERHGDQTVVKRPKRNPPAHQM